MAMRWGVHTRLGQHLLLASLLCTCALPIRADAPVVHSSAPQQPSRRLRFEEDWRLGGEDSELLFGLMVGATADSAGNVYLMDQQLNQVTVVSPQGEVLRQLFREGEGPGEIRTPQGIAVLQDGRVGLVQQFPGKLILVDAQGDPAGALTFAGGGAGKQGYTMAAGCTARAGTFLLAGMHQVPEGETILRTSYLAAIQLADGSERIRYRSHLTVLDPRKAHFSEREMFAPCYTHALGSDGRVYCARDWREYAIEVLSPGGALERVITRDFAPLARDQRAKDRMNELFRVQAAQLPYPITWEIEPAEQYITGLRVDAGGRLWVSHNRSNSALPTGVFTSYDIFDAAGRWIRIVHVACAGDPAYDGLLFLPDDRVLLVKGLILASLTASGSQGANFDEDGGSGEMEVICGRLVAD